MLKAVEKSREDIAQKRMDPTKFEMHKPTNDCKDIN